MADGNSRRFIVELTWYGEKYHIINARILRRWMEEKGIESIIDLKNKNQEDVEWDII